MNIKRFITALIATVTLMANMALANDNTTIPVGVSGYDLVSYHQDSGPTTGNGHHSYAHEGVTYLFKNGDNKKAFSKNPSKYLPEFGGYCAYGAALGKKFYGDPTVYEIVGGKLYLNLDKKIQGLWAKDKSGHIASANKLWSTIKYVPANEL